MHALFKDEKPVPVKKSLAGLKKKTRSNLIKTKLSIKDI